MVARRHAQNSGGNDVTSVQPSLAPRWRARRRDRPTGVERGDQRGAAACVPGGVPADRGAVWVLASAPMRPFSGGGFTDVGATRTEPPPSTAPATSLRRPTSPVTRCRADLADGPSTSAAASTTVTVAATTTVPPVVATTDRRAPVTVRVRTARPPPPHPHHRHTVHSPPPAQMPAEPPIDEDEALAFVLTTTNRSTPVIRRDLAEADAGVPRRPQSHLRELQPILAQHFARTRRLAVHPGPGPDEARVRFAARYNTRAEWSTRPTN